MWCYTVFNKLKKNRAFFLCWFEFCCQADKLLVKPCCSSFSPIFTSAIGSVFCKWDLPVFTLPFNMALTLCLAASGPHNLFFPTTVIHSATTTPNITWTDAEMPMVGCPEDNNFLDLQRKPLHNLIFFLYITALWPGYTKLYL